MTFLEDRRGVSNVLSGVCNFVGVDQQYVLTWNDDYNQDSDDDDG